MPKAIRLQSRDIQLLNELGLVGLLDTETIHRRHFAEDKHCTYCRRRLYLYRQHGLTQHLDVPIASTTRRGRTHTIHRLTSVGADVIESELGVRPLRFVRSDAPTPRTILHRLGIAKLILAVNDACKLAQLSAPDWILDYDTNPGAPIGAPKAQRFRLYEDFPGPNGTKAPCSPDAACLITLPNKSAAGETSQHGLVLYWEYDRSTETRKQIDEDKLPGYHALLNHKAYRKLWPTAEGIRVLFVLQSEQRLTNIAGVLLRQADADRFYRIATVADTTAEHVLSAPVWRTPSGERRRILG